VYHREGIKSGNISSKFQVLIYYMFFCGIFSVFDSSLPPEKKKASSSPVPKRNRVRTRADASEGIPSRKTGEAGRRLTFTIYVRKPSARRV
jgi:hypothetical protein